MSCRHGTPAPNECMWIGEPPSCLYCKIEELERKLKQSHQDRQEWRSRMGLKVTDDIVKENMVLTAERDRLREALQKIRRFYLSSKPIKQIAFEAIEIAGQALEES